MPSGGYGRRAGFIPDSGGKFQRFRIREALPSLRESENTKPRSLFLVGWTDRHYDRYKGEPTELRPLLPCHRAAFGGLEEWMEKDKKVTNCKLGENPGARGGEQLSLGQGGSVLGDGS